MTMPEKIRYKVGPLEIKRQKHNNEVAKITHDLFFNPNWHEAGHFLPPCPFWIRFCQPNFYQKFQNFFWQ
jgi:hypothetical protein